VWSSGVCSVIVFCIMAQLFVGSFNFFFSILITIWPVVVSGQMCLDRFQRFVC
jgi:hypothetical protein